MSQRMDAEILFLNPDDVNPGVAELVARDFKVEILDWVDPYGPTVWIKAQVTSELDEHRFFDWVASIVEPLHGDVVEAGLSDPQQAAYHDGRRFAARGRRRATQNQGSEGDRSYDTDTARGDHHLFR